MRGFSESVIIGYLAWRILAGGWARKLTDSLALALFILSAFNCRSNGGANWGATEKTIHDCDRPDPARHKPVLKKYPMIEENRNGKLSAGRPGGIVSAVRRAIARPFAGSPADRRGATTC